MACAANFGVAAIRKTSAPDAFNLTTWEVNGRFGDLVGRHGDDLVEPECEHIPQAGQIIAAKVVILRQYGNLRCLQFFNGVLGIEPRLKAKGSLNSHQRLWELGNIAKLRRARRQEELRNVLCLQVFRDGVVLRGTE